jgi:hypothetical protein
MLKTPARLTISMVTITVLVTDIPMAAFAQAAKEEQQEEESAQVQDQEEQGNNPANPT